jgi:hypothetical protein
LKKQPGCQSCGFLGGVYPLATEWVRAEELPASHDGTIPIAAYCAGLRVFSHEFLLAAGAICVYLIVARRL